MAMSVRRLLQGIDGTRQLATTITLLKCVIPLACSYTSRSLVCMFLYCKTNTMVAFASKWVNVQPQSLYNDIIVCIGVGLLGESVWKTGRAFSTNDLPTSAVLWNAPTQLFGTAHAT